MDVALVFKIANLAVLLPWALLICAPKWNWTKRLLFTPIFPILLSILYLTCFIWFWGIAGGEAGFGSLEAVATFFSYKELVLVGWVHYLAVDLFVGTWITADSQQKEIPHLLVVPCLIVALLACPIGILLYALLRGILSKEVNFFG